MGFVRRIIKFYYDMHHSKLQDREQQFIETGVAARRSFKMNKFTLPINGEELKLEGYTVRPADGFEGYFYAQKFDKKRIVLHFTVGHIQGDINALSDPRRGHVSTAFVLGRTGAVFQLFSSYHWSYHLGRGALGGNGTGSKSSIGIEISNYGPLIKRGNNLETVYSREAGHDVYCSLDDTDQYIKLDKPFRGYEYYTQYTDAQYDSLIVLLRYLTARYEIPRAFLAPEERWETSLANATFEGIISHVNSRTDKVDIGPAFDWERVIEGVKAPVYPVPQEIQQVKALKTEIEALKAKLKSLETELIIAEQEAADAAAIAASRSTEVDNSPVAIPKGRMVYFSERGIDQDFPVPVRPGDMGEEGYESEESGTEGYYLED